MRSMFGNLLKQVWLIARQVKSLKHPQYGAIRVVVKVLWTDSAVPQLQAIPDYVAQTSPDYAVRIVDRLTRRSIQIAAFPTLVEWCQSETATLTDSFFLADP